MNLKYGENKQTDILTQENFNTLKLFCKRMEDDSGNQKGVDYARLAWASIQTLINSHKYSPQDSNYMLDGCVGVLKRKLEKYKNTGQIESEYYGEVVIALYNLRQFRNKIISDFHKV